MDGIRFLQRLLTYALYGAPLVGLVPASYLLGEKFPDLEHATWSYLVWAIQQLGPCFVKLAQWASTRPDLFPPKLVEKIEVSKYTPTEDPFLIVSFPSGLTR